MKKVSLDTKTLILNHINSKDYIKSTLKQIILALDLSRKDLNSLDRIIFELECEGKIYIDDSKRLCLIDNKEYFICKYEAKSKGFGFATIISKNSGEKEEIHILKENNLQSFNSDIILVRVVKTQEIGKRLEGIVVKIIKRGNENIVGKFVKSEGFGFVMPINQGINDIYIPGKAIGNLRNNDIVKVEVIKYPTDTKKAEGRIVELIGSEGDKNIESTSIFASFRT